MVASIVYCVCTSAILIFLPKVIQRLSRPLYWLVAISCCYLGFGLVIQYAINPLELLVDRWSAIHNFLEGMLAGIYPYGQQTHLGGYGSPLPVWQVLHLPFYAMGNVGLSIFVVIGLFIYTIYRTRGAHTAIAATIMLTLSPACWYEMAVRSDLITNILLIACITEWLSYKRIALAHYTLPIAVLSGLVLSTRLIAIIPLAAMYGYEFLHMGWKKQATFVCCTILTFAITLLPFVLWDGSTLLFFEYNPFVLQTRQGSVGALILFATIAILITIYMRGDQQTRLPITGGLLTCLVSIAFIEKMWKEDLWNQLFDSTFDITYLAVALPFYILCVAQCSTSPINDESNS